MGSSQNYMSFRLTKLLTGDCIGDMKGDLVVKTLAHRFSPRASPLPKSTELRFLWLGTTDSAILKEAAI